MNCIYRCIHFVLLPSSVLTYIFMIDVNLPYTQPTSSPRIADFTRRVVARLKPPMEGDEEIQNHVMEENEVGEPDERTQAIKLLKTGEEPWPPPKPTLRCNRTRYANRDGCEKKKRML